MTLFELANEHLSIEGLQSILDEKEEEVLARLLSNIELMNLAHEEF